MKKIIVIMMAMAMIFSFAGCGGGGGASESGGDQQEGGSATTEGIQKVVFSVPEGWEKIAFSKGARSAFQNPDHNVSIGVECTDESNLSSFVDIEETKTLEDYYKELTTPSNEDGEEKDVETTKVLGQDAKAVKIKKDDGFVDIGTYLMKDGVIYDFYIFKNNTRDDNGKLKKDAEVLSDEEMAVYEDFLASVEEGDGADLQMQGVKTDELAEITFEAPEGFSVQDMEKEYASFTNEKEVGIIVEVINNDNVKYHTVYDEGGENEVETFANIEEYYEYAKKGETKDIKIADHDGFISDETDQFMHAGFMTDNAVYLINLSAYGAGEDAVLSKDDQAAYKAFLESIKVK